MLWTLLLHLAAAEATPTEKPALIATCEPLGQASDASARTLEGLVRAQTEAFAGCWASHVAPDTTPEPIRFVQVEVKLKQDGTVKKTNVTSSTGVMALDACVQGLAASLAVTPPPMFDDRLQLNITWPK